MKSTTYIVEITTYQKEWKVSVCGEKSTCLLACSPACLVPWKKFSMWVYWKLFCCFWSIKLHNLPHVALMTPVFLGIFFIIPFMVWLEDSSQIKGRGYIFMSSKHSVNLHFYVCKHLAEAFFLIRKLNIVSFVFLIWTEHFWIWFSQKLIKNIKILIVF